MKLLYTDIGQDMTGVLTNEAEVFEQAGKRVFYIAPNSLSFEKERKVLGNLTKKASFAITITRFAQMARYFTLKEKQDSDSLDELGLTLIFYRVLSDLSEDNLQIYGHFRKDPQLMKQLVALYQELQKSQLSIEDLLGLEPKKWSDLKTILTAVDQFLKQEGFALESAISRFAKVVQSGSLDQDLSETVIIVDGFTRFSAEEESLLGLLNERCHQIVIGTYASQKAYRATYRQGHIYQASVDFLLHLAEIFETKPIFIPREETETAFDYVTAKVEAMTAFETDVTPLSQADYPISIWEVSNQKAELEAVARDIRAKLFEGYRYKDIRVLLGNTDSYRLQLSHVFQRYGIPYYFSKAETMAHHPLVHFVESLERLKRYAFRGEDLIQLLKTGLYGQFSFDEIDRFEDYCRFADVKGLSAFQKRFVHNQHGRFDLDELNAIRERVIGPLADFLKTTPQKMTSLLTKWTMFLENIKLTDNLTDLLSVEHPSDTERHEEVWRAFRRLLETMQLVFKDTSLSLSEFLTLMTTSMQTMTYRLVPATVDVVNVNGYELIEPHRAKIVYAIGLTQGNFPKLASNLSLISDQERHQINQNLGQDKLTIASQDNQKRSHFIFLSLLNAASDHLILSCPRLHQETEESRSPYLTLLQQLGLPIEEKRVSGKQVDDLGSYYGLLSRLIDFYQGDLKAEDFSKEEQTFWSVAIRLLRKKLDKDGLYLPQLNDEASSSPLSPETLSKLYPKDKPFYLSASALTNFYNNEYAYFLTSVLGLQEDLSIHPDARHDGNFLHRVFERVMADESDKSFDEKLDRALEATKSEPDQQLIYGQDAQSRYTQERLEEIVKSTSLILREQSVVEVVAEEAVFGQDVTGALDLDNGHKLLIRGKIDRLDRLKALDSYGVVDYKSSDKSFRLADFYNKLSPQLMTYLFALTRERQLTADQLFGAMYLHMQTPSVALSDTQSADEVLSHLHKDMRYKGLFLESQTNQLDQAYDSSRSAFSREELEVMIAYTEKLYRDAAEQILRGQFDINPYTKDGQTVLGQQFKAITGFEANRHLSQARQITAFPRTKQKDWIMSAMKGDLD